MPVDLRSHRPDDPIDVRPGTNEADVLKLLYAAPHLGFTPSEVREETEMPSGSVTTTLSRLLEKGYIGKTADGLYHALDGAPHVARFAESLVKLDEIATRYPNAGFDEELVEGVAEEDTGRQPIPESRRQSLEAEGQAVEPPLGEELVEIDESESEREESLPGTWSTIHRGISSGCLIRPMPTSTGTGL